ncbi:MAG: hypothetical protein LBE78_07490 [Burkholderiaceae bacterium]|nr:hypothetical protein [Burkholderiaceae bacterium]
MNTDVSGFDNVRLLGEHSYALGLSHPRARPTAVSRLKQKFTLLAAVAPSAQRL